MDGGRSGQNTDQIPRQCVSSKENMSVLYIGFDMRRTSIYDKFRKHEKELDGRSMDALCEDTATDFRLQAQQEFLREYITEHPDWKNLLLYHQAGSGKTCTAITMAERYKQLNPNGKVTVILPARLKTNFIDELISPCGMQTYISQKDYDAYHSGTITDAQKESIRKQFLSAINAAYNIITFDTIRRSAKQAQSLSQWVTEMTENTLLIVDEVHNLVSDKYKEDQYQVMVDTDRMLFNVKGSWAMLFRIINEKAHRSCKMIYLTASPIFDNLKQMYELVRLMAPAEADEITVSSRLSEVIEYLRGKVSYFPGTSPNAYPVKEFIVHDVQITKPIDHVVFFLQTTKHQPDNDNAEAFLIRERQALVSVYEASHKTMQSAKRKEFKLYAPKVVELVKQIEALKGKHVVYSTFVDNGLDVVELLMRLHGWRRYGEDGAKPYKVYCVWDGRLKDNDKDTLKVVLNNVSNMDGSKIRVVLGSPSIKEGVSFKHIQHLHMLDPVWNGSALMQVEARAVRFCSHIDIPSSGVDGIVRKVVIHHYKAVPMASGGQVDFTADQRIYERIIPRKKLMVEMGEKALQKVAIDYYLFRKLYRDPITLSPIPKQRKGVPSPILLDRNVRLNEKPTNNTQDIRPKCGRALVPVNGECPDGYQMRFNNRGDPCCYKTKQRKQKNQEN